MTPAKRKAVIAGLAATMVASPSSVDGEGLQVQPDAFKGLVKLRSYQMPVFLDRTTKVLMLEWSRQIGKSFTLANWCIDRLLTQLQKFDQWTILVLSNSKDNGGEFAMKAGDAARRLGEAIQSVEATLPVDESAGIEYEDMKFRVEIRIGGTKVGRIIVLAANPRTARGFSGDLILDEFAFHENAKAIWAAAEPIISANPEFLCRIASTHNGKESMFNQMLLKQEEDGSWTFPRLSLKRSEAWKIGELTINSIKGKGLPITPEEAEAEAMDRAEYRQNYENEPGDEQGALIPMELINLAMEHGIYYAVDKEEWSAATLQRLHRMLWEPGSVFTAGEFVVGQDVARTTDLSAVEVLWKNGPIRIQVASLEMLGKPIDYQQRQMDALINIIRPRLRRVCIDSTGLGTGLADYLTRDYGSLIIGCNFSSTVPITDAVAATGRKALTMTLPERMALDLLALFEDRQIHLVRRHELMLDLRKPGKVVSKDGKRVSIAAARGKDGHADRFWALALAEHGFQEDAFGSFAMGDAEKVEMGHSAFRVAHVSFDGVEQEW